MPLQNHLTIKTQIWTNRYFWCNRSLICQVPLWTVAPCAAMIPHSKVTVCLRRIPSWRSSCRYWSRAWRIIKKRQLQQKQQWWKLYCRWKSSFRRSWRTPPLLLPSRKRSNSLTLRRTHTKITWLHQKSSVTHQIWRSCPLSNSNNSSTRKVAGWGTLLTKPRQRTSNCVKQTRCNWGSEAIPMMPSPLRRLRESTRRSRSKVHQISGRANGDSNRTQATQTLIWRPVKHRWQQKNNWCILQRSARRISIDRVRQAQTSMYCQRTPCNSNQFWQVVRAYTQGLSSQCPPGSALGSSFERNESIWSWATEFCGRIYFH